MQVDPVLLDLITDARLSSDARVLGAYIAGMGDGAHEIPRDVLGDVLSNETSADRIRRAVAQLERLKWVERTAGGRGHADRFEFKGADSTEPKSDSMQIPRTLKPLVVEEEDEVEETPIVPFPVLSAEAEAAIEKSGDKLKGCRDSLRDYLRSRVPHDRQKPYVYMIVAWLDDSDPAVWRKPSGGWLEHSQRTTLLATALNELGATNEKKRKYDPGDPANLKTKINILLQQRERHGNRGKSDTRSTGTEGPANPGGQSHRRRRPPGADD